MKVCIASLLVALAAGSGLSACSVIGFGLGTMTPSYSDDPALLTNGATVLVEPRGPGEGPARLIGTYRGNDGGIVIVESGAGEQRLFASHQVEVEARDGTHWLTGLLIGFGIDAIVTGLVIHELMTSGGEE